MTQLLRGFSSQQYSTIIELLKKLEKKIDGIQRATKVPHKKTWVNPSVITELTGWDGKSGKLRWAKRNHLVEARTTETGTVEYLLESINPAFLKRQL